MIRTYADLMRSRAAAAKNWHGGQDDEEYARKYDELNHQLQALHKDMSDAGMIDLGSLTSGAEILAEGAVPPDRIGEFRETELHFGDFVSEAMRPLIPPPAEREKAYELKRAEERKIE
jgi:hypothetical protein